MIALIKNFWNLPLKNRVLASKTRSNSKKVKLKNPLRKLLFLEKLQIQKYNNKDRIKSKNPSQFRASNQFKLCKKLNRYHRYLFSLHNLKRSLSKKKRLLSSNLRPKRLTLKKSEPNNRKKKVIKTRMNKREEEGRKAKRTRTKTRFDSLMLWHKNHY